jgi:hypothetical protein
VHYSGYNLYRYVGNNSIKYNDPFGHELEFGIDQLNNNMPAIKGTYKFSEYYVDPWSDKHIFRNNNNVCPSKRPDSDEKYKNDGWKSDVAGGMYHGGPSGKYKTYRGSKKYLGCQCTYDEECELVDSGPWMGTYDYQPPIPGKPWTIHAHQQADVHPHKRNPNYAAMLTRKY